MWIEGTANGTYIRRTLKTGSWERATDLARMFEDADDPATAPERRDESLTIIQAVTEYLADAKARELSAATVYKLDIFFRKQFLAWCQAEGCRLLPPRGSGFSYLMEGRRNGRRRKNRSLTGFFWFCFRANWITTNTTNNLGRISIT